MTALNSALIFVALGLASGKLHAAGYIRRPAAQSPTTIHKLSDVACIQSFCMKGNAKEILQYASISNDGCTLTCGFADYTKNINSQIKDGEACGTLDTTVCFKGQCVVKSELETCKDLAEKNNTVLNTMSPDGCIISCRDALYSEFGRFPGNEGGSCGYCSVPGYNFLCKSGECTPIKKASSIIEQ